MIVGADRIAANGDTANKIGTYSLAVLARAHAVPFFVAAPLSTFDAGLADGSAIPIEQRSATELLRIDGHPLAPLGVPALNAAFDVTQAELIDAIVTERGVIRPPLAAGIAAQLGMRCLTRHLNAPRARTVNALVPTCVLIVEDDRSLASVLSRAVEQMGYAARVVHDGQVLLSANGPARVVSSFCLITSPP